MNNLRADLQHALSRKGRPAGNAFVKHCPQAEQIAATIDRLA